MLHPDKTSKDDSLYSSRGYVPNDGGTLKFNTFTQTTCHALPNILVEFRLRKSHITVKIRCTVTYGGENILPFFKFEFFSKRVIYESMSL